MPDQKFSGALLAFDFGTQHIGVAVGQSITGTARGVATLKARDGAPAWRHVKDLLDTYRPALLVVGLPLNMDGTASAIADQARQFAALLEQKADLNVAMQDERLTTVQAKEQLDWARAADKANTDHELAACFIAEDWLAANAAL
ncbi:MAG: Holliday junction resolvase RuvX [Pseudomonadota bacterium]